MSTTGNKDFDDFVSLFPEVVLPVTLSSEYVEVFSKYNKPIPEILIKKYILGEEIYIPDNISLAYTPEHLKNNEHNHSNINLQEINLDVSALEDKNETSQTQNTPSSSDEKIEDEYIACLKLPGITRFVGLVYLKIGLLTYEYFLHTYEKNGKTISKQKIASMTVENDVIKEHVAMIDEDLIILIMEGDKNTNEEFNPQTSHFLSFEIDDDGKISKYKL